MFEPCPSRALLQGFSLADIQQLADETPNLRGYLQGYLAELRLKTLLEAVPEVQRVEKIPDSAPVYGDFLVEYKGESLQVEAKSFRSRSEVFNPLSQSWEASVDCKNPGSRLLQVKGQGEVRATCIEEHRFDILAVCTQPVTGQWTFLFAPEVFLPRAENKPGFLQGRFKVNPTTSPGFFWEPSRAFDLALSIKNTALK